MVEHFPFLPQLVTCVYWLTHIFYFLLYISMNICKSVMGINLGITNKFESVGEITNFKSRNSESKLYTEESGRETNSEEMSMISPCHI